VAKQNIGPRISAAAKDFYAGHFSSVNAGASYVLEAWPGLYRATMIEMRGLFSRNELMLFLDVSNGRVLTSGMAGYHLLADVFHAVNLDGSGLRWGIDKTELLAKLSGLLRFQIAVLELWAQESWRREDMDLIRQLADDPAPDPLEPVQSA